MIILKMKSTCLGSKKMLVQKKHDAFASNLLVFVDFVGGCDNCRTSCLWNKTLAACRKRMPLHFRSQTLLQRQSPNQNRRKQQFRICLLSTLYSETSSYRVWTLYAVNIHSNQVTVNWISSKLYFLIVKQLLNFPVEKQSVGS